MPAATSSRRSDASRKPPKRPAAPPTSVATPSTALRAGPGRPSSACFDVNPYEPMRPTDSVARRRCITAARAISTAEAPVSASPKRRTISTGGWLLDLDVHDALDDVRPQDDHHSREQERDPAAGRLEQGVGVAGADDRDRDEQHDGERRDDPAG